MSRSIYVLNLLAIVALLLSACTTATPEAIEATAPPEPAVEDTVADEPAEEEEPAPAEEEAEAEPAEPTDEPAGPPRGGTAVFTIGSEPETLNPYLTSAAITWHIIEAIVEGLVGLDREGEYFPLLASELPTAENGGVVVNDDDTMKVTWKLREDVVWSDGEPFTADDVLFTYEAVTHPESMAYVSSGFDRVSEVELVDDYTIVLHYDEFYVGYMDQFKEGILPRHATGDPANMPEWDFNRRPVGTGPMVLEEWATGDHISLVRNENYREEGKPYIDGITYPVVPDGAVEREMLKEGTSDIILWLNELYIEEMEAHPNVDVAVDPGIWVLKMVLNTSMPNDGVSSAEPPHPILGDVRVRKAIQMAMNVPSMIDIFGGYSFRATSPLFMGWYQVDIPAWEHDPDTARDLLEEAGWTDEDGDGVRECHGCLHADEGTKMEMMINSYTGWPELEEVEVLVVEMLRDIGMELTIRNDEFAVIFASFASGGYGPHGDFDLMFYDGGFRGDPQAYVENEFASWNIPSEENGGRGHNWAHWESDEFDRWIKVAGSTSDMETRKEAYQNAMEVVAAELPHIYFMTFPEVAAYSTRLENWKHSTWMSIVWDIEDWYIDDSS